MGRWDRRWIPRRRYNSKKYRDYDYEEPPPLPPSPHHPQSNPPPIQEDSGSSWEIEFCKSVRVPWKKILAAKNFMYCYETVVKWDDSAAEEAFHDAKRRYWEKINCHPCETPLPDEDMYIDEINWNPYIDPKLISNLDQEYFNPDEVEKAGTLQTGAKGRNNALPVCVPVQNDENPVELPWGSDTAQGVGALSNSMLHWGQNTKPIDSEDVNNPWERSCTLVDKSLKNNAWKGSSDKGPTQEVGTMSIDSRDVNGPWKQSQFDESLRNNAWKGSTGETPAQGVRTLLGQNAKSLNSKDVKNPWEQSLSRFDESLTKGYAGVNPQGVRTHWGLNSKSINLEEGRNSQEQSCIRFDDSLKNNARKGSAAEMPGGRVGTHFGQCADSINPKDVNHWEQSCTSVPEESWRWRKESTYNRWSAENAGDKRWTSVDDRSRVQKQWNISSHKQVHPVNTENSWKRSFPSHIGVSCSGRGWTEHGNNTGGWKQPDIHSKLSKNVNNQRPSRGGRMEESGCRKRESSLQHSPRHKTSRFQGDSYMTAQKW